MMRRKNSLADFLALSVHQFGKEVWITYGATKWHRLVEDRIRTGLGESREVRTLTFQILEKYLGYTATLHLLDETRRMSWEEYVAMMVAVDRVARNSPIQYVLGHVDFLGYEIRVNRAVLIPRPETEHMVRVMRREERLVRPRILDIGTGSGCIAIALGLHWRPSDVTAVDVEPAALEVAQRNAQRHGLSLSCCALDILKEPLPDEKWDLIVSNPPYVPQGEKAAMDGRIIHHEPHKALFVPDEQPLLFYERMAEIARHHLVDGGRLYTEVHEHFATDVCTLYARAGLCEVKICADFHEKPRWVVASYSS